MKTFTKPLIIIVFLICLSAFYAISKIKHVSAAYLYGYPIVMLEQTRLASSAAGEVEADANKFKHIQSFPDHAFRKVVRPNNDTLYSIAWINLAHEPLILSVPDTHGRYYVMPFMDAWSNVFAMVGQRTTGSGAGHYGVVGPNWEGDLPEDAIRIESPTNMVWLIGRIQTNGVQDIDNVIALQSEFRLTPLSQWGRSSINPSYNSKIDNSQSDQRRDSPMAVVDSFSATDFFSRLSKLIAQQGYPESDAGAISNLASIGVVAGQPLSEFGFVDNFLFNKAIEITHRKLSERIKSRPDLTNGWLVHRSIIGNYGTAYPFRAGVAKVGLGALPPQEAVYPNTNLDSRGKPLQGSKRYKIHFEKGETPPADAFWSLSLYDDEGYFIDNPINRYSIGDRDDLMFNSDGSLDIFIQESEPLAGSSNWLPAPAHGFALTMRLYSPNERFLNGEWRLPEVVRQP